MTPGELRQEVGKKIMGHNYDTGPLLLLAGPGTGKTFSLVRTIQGSGGKSFRPNEFYEATLTNAAADKFLEDVRKTIPEFDNSSTVHFRAKGVLHRFADRLGIPNDFVIFTEDERTTVLDDLHHFLDNSVDLDHEAYAYKRARAEGAELDSGFARIYFRLQLFYKAIDWFDVVYYATRLLGEYEDIRKRVSSEFMFLLIDEYQDLNDADQRFVELLLNGRPFLLAVGDDDQSIYSGRFADPTGIVQFDKRYQKSTKITLPVSSRCPTGILKPAHLLISKNNDREKKPMLIPLPEVDNRANGGFAICVNTKSERAEIDFVGKALDMIVGIGARPEQILVLCLNKKLGLDMCQTIRLAFPNLPISDMLQDESPNSDELLLHHLRLFLVDRQNNLPLRMILDAINDDAGFSVSSLVEEAINARMTLWQVISRDNRVPPSIGQFVDTVNNALRRSDIKSQLEYLCLNYRQFEHLQALIPTLEEIKEPNLTNENRIKFMTMHSSKGLEADFVFIPFMESDFSLPARDIEEQRRLLYVAITRAKVGLVFSWAWSRRSKARFKAGGGPNTGRRPSHFISECGLDPSMFGWANSIPPPNEKAHDFIREFATHLSQAQT